MFSFLCFSSVLAVNLGTGSDSLLSNVADQAGYEEVNKNTLPSKVGFIINSILSVSGVIFTALVVYAGILWMTAQGDKDQVEKSKDIIKNSIIGLGIALAAYSITNFVLPILLSS